MNPSIWAAFCQVFDRQSQAGLLRNSFLGGKKRRFFSIFFPAKQIGTVNVFSIHKELWWAFLCLTFFWTVWSMNSLVRLLLLPVFFVCFKWLSALFATGLIQLLVLGFSTGPYQTLSASRPTSLKESMEDFTYFIKFFQGIGLLSHWNKHFLKCFFFLPRKDDTLPDQLWQQVRPATPV